jgi:hypothetical protein
MIMCGEFVRKGCRMGGSGAIAKTDEEMAWQRENDWK